MSDVLGLSIILNRRYVFFNICPLCLCFMFSCKLKNGQILFILIRIWWKTMTSLSTLWYTLQWRLRWKHDLNTESYTNATFEILVSKTLFLRFLFKNVRRTNTISSTFCLVLLFLLTQFWPFLSVLIEKYFFSFAQLYQHDCMCFCFFCSWLGICDCLAWKNVLLSVLFYLNRHHNYNFICVQTLYLRLSKKVKSAKTMQNLTYLTCCKDKRIKL